MSLQSLTIDYILYLKTIQTYVYKIGGPILIIIGSLSCTLSLTVFTKKNLRKNPCSVYLIAFNIINLILIYSSILSVTLSAGYNISPSIYNLHYCRYNFYMSILLDILSPCYLILASADRMLVTSSNIALRQRSTRRLAYICIIIVTLFWALFHSHLLYAINIIQLAPNTFICYIQSGIHVTIQSYYSVIAKALLITTLMVVFGLLTVRNIRKSRLTAVAPISTVTGTTMRTQDQSTRSKDRQFFLLLSMDIIKYMLFSFMLSGLYLYGLITQKNMKTSLQTQFETILRNIAIFINFISICIGCFTNMLVSKTFRNEIKTIFSCR